MAVTDYKALVCVYLDGGNDGNNMIVPIDLANFQKYKTARGDHTLPPDLTGVTITPTPVTTCPTLNPQIGLPLPTDARTAPTLA